MAIAATTHNALTAPLQKSPLSASVGRAPMAGFGEYRYGMPPLQRKTQIQYGPLQNFTYVWGTKPADQASGNVATSMHAELDPNDPAVGTDTTGSNAFNTLFSALQNNPPASGSSWVRGHLLNHDLGGLALYNNLFPITTSANSEHSQEVEKNVKHWIGEGCSVTYDVDAHQCGTVGSPDGAFVCEAEVTADPLASGLAGAKIEKVIYSHGVGKATTVRSYGSKADQTVVHYSGVQHGKGNNVSRDEYGSLSKDPNWQHATGNGTTNNVDIKGLKSLGTIDISKWGSGKGKSISSLDYGYNFSVPQFNKFII